MGSDIYCFIEKQIGDEWFVCKKDGSVYDTNLTLQAYRDKTRHGLYYQFDDILTDIDEKCGFDIVRNYTAYHCILGWDEPRGESYDVITPQFSPVTTSSSFIYEAVKDSCDNYYFSSLTLQDFFDYDFNTALVISPKGKRTLLKEDAHYYDIFMDIVSRLSAAGGDPESVRIIMRYD